MKYQSTYHNNAKSLRSPGLMVQANRKPARYHSIVYAQETLIITRSMRTWWMIMKSKRKILTKVFDILKPMFLSGALKLNCILTLWWTLFMECRCKQWTSELLWNFPLDLSDTKNDRTTSDLFPEEGLQHTVIWKRWTNEIDFLFFVWVWKQQNSSHTRWQKLTNQNDFLEE